MGKITFKIFPKNKLIIERFSGAFLLSDYEQMKKDEFIHPDYDQNFDVLADLRDGYYESNSISPDKILMSVTNFLKSSKEKIGKRKCAFIAINPEQVVSSIFYENFIKELPIVSKSFTTLNAAMEWLAIKDKDDLLDYLK
jgi:hypothetical protein